MRNGFVFLALLVSFMLFGCAALSGGPKPPITQPTEMPSFPPLVTPTPSPTPAPTPTPSPTPSNPAQAAAEACRTSFIDQIYQHYQPAYCSGAPPCTPKTEAEVKALISLDTRSAPIMGFTYQVGQLCSVTTFFGRADSAPTECTLRNFVIDSQTTAMVPC